MGLAMDSLKQTLDNLLEDSAVKKYLTGTRPTTRHEAWWLVNALSTVRILNELEKLNKNIDLLLKSKKKRPKLGGK